ncbi:hypothetical protein GR268_27325 [Rhizobium leguminosarum]|nr:hypothetical protein [Rhizobium leguminosarum]
MAHGSNRTATEARKWSSPVPVTILSQRDAVGARNRCDERAEKSCGQQCWQAVASFQDAVLSLTAHCAPAAPASRRSRPLQFDSQLATPITAAQTTSVGVPRRKRPDDDGLTVFLNGVTVFVANNSAKSWQTLPT